MTSLIIDTAFTGTLVAIADNAGKILVEKLNPDPYGQGDVLVPMMEAALAEAGIGYDNLSKIAVVNGPGAFTGLRAGLSSARMLVRVLKIPGLGVSSFDAMLQTYWDKQKEGPEGKKILVLIETKREDFYVRADDVDLVLKGEEIAKRYNKDDYTLIGDAVQRFAQNNPGYAFFDIQRPDAKSLAKLVLAERGASDLMPVYLRDADVSIPKT